MSDVETRSAAVLLILYKKADGYYLILTKRTETVLSHKGHISLPGGKFEEKDKTLETTALREGFEEIGLKPEDVRILDTLDPVKTKPRFSNFEITPFIVTIPTPYKFKANPNEVEKIIEVPLLFLLDEKNYLDDRWMYDSHLIWGVTARILNQFLEKCKKNGVDSFISNI